MTISKPAWRVIALVTAGALFWLATRSDVYNTTSPRGMAQSLFGPDFVPFRHPWWLSLHIWVRKAYSIVAFTIVGYTANRALGVTTRPALRAAVAVGTYSLGIEMAQRLFVASEPTLESVIDVGCGALGGWLAILADEAISEKNDARKHDSAKRHTQQLGSRNNY